MLDRKGLSRLLLRRAPHVFSYALWALVLLRLLLPFTFESKSALLPNVQTVLSAASETVVPTAAPVVLSNVPQAIDPVAAPAVLTANDTTPVSNVPALNAPVEAPKATISPWQIAFCVWGGGVLAMLLYGAISYGAFVRRMRFAVRTENGVYESDRIATALVLGVIRPRIYLPTGLCETERELALAHERTHLKRLDPLTQWLAFLALSVHWFNPFVWLAFFLARKDMEMCCDERVLRAASTPCKRDYARTLLTLSARRSGLPMPLSFGESRTKSRVQNVLRFKKPKVWMLLLAVLLVAATTVVCTVQRTPSGDDAAGSPVADASPSAQATSSADEVQYVCFDARMSVPPTVTLHRTDKTFTFSYDPLSSYLSVGTYALNDDVLTLRTDDGLYTYVFYYDNDTLAFVPDASSPLPADSFAAGIDRTWPGGNGMFYALHTADACTDAAKVQAVQWDCDGDGTQEVLILSDGPTSGLFTEYLSVYRDGALIGRELFYVTASVQPYFRMGADGAVGLCFANAQTGETALVTQFQILLQDGDPVLISDDATVQSDAYYSSILIGSIPAEDFVVTVGDANFSVIETSADDAAALLNLKPGAAEEDAMGYVVSHLNGDGFALSSIDGRIVSFTFAGSVLQTSRGLSIGDAASAVEPAYGRTTSVYTQGGVTYSRYWCAADDTDGVAARYYLLIGVANGLVCSIDYEFDV